MTTVVCSGVLTAPFARGQSDLAVPKFESVHGGIPQARVTKLLQELSYDTGFSIIDTVRNLVGHRLSGTPDPALKWSLENLPSRDSIDPLIGHKLRSAVFLKEEPL